MESQNVFFTYNKSQYALNYYSSHHIFICLPPIHCIQYEGSPIEPQITLEYLCSLKNKELFLNVRNGWKWPDLEPARLPKGVAGRRIDAFVSPKQVEASNLVRVFVLPRAPIIWLCTRRFSPPKHLSQRALFITQKTKKYCRLRSRYIKSDNPPWYDSPLPRRRRWKKPLS